MVQTYKPNWVRGELRKLSGQSGTKAAERDGNSQAEINNSYHTTLVNTRLGGKDLADAGRRWFARLHSVVLHRGMPDFAAPVERLIDELKHLPGIGQKTAQRLAFHLLRLPAEDALALADAIRDAKANIRECTVCGNITDADPCLYCTGANRNKRIICVVEEPHNIMAIEKTRMYSGMYHVLGGSLAPLQGRGPDQLKIKQLIERLKGGAVEEIIIATNPTAEGEATAMYLSKLLKPLGVRVTRIGVGIPVGADLEYADEVTMMKAMEGRRDL
jgi:recombination protein RecR